MNAARLSPTCRNAFLSIGVLLVSACVGGQTTGYRDAKIPLGVTTRGGAAQIAGEWVVRAHYPGDEDLRGVNYLPDWQGSPVFELVSRSCEENGDCEDVGDIWRARPIAQNRWKISNPNTGEARDLWVIWVDEGFRTAVIGAPDGRYGWILDRKAKGGADRIRAARQILDFNGYDTGALMMRAN